MAGRLILKLPNIELLRMRGVALVNVFYFLPDFPHILNSYHWQTNDVSPDFPRVTRLLEYWTLHIEGKLHSVHIAHRPTGGGPPLRIATVSFTLQ